MTLVRTGRTEKRRLRFSFAFSSPAIHNVFMPRRKLTPVEVLGRLLRRLEKRMEALQRVKLAGFEMVISELEVECDYLRRAIRYLEE
jgi:hypothetical protein